MYSSARAIRAAPASAPYSGAGSNGWSARERKGAVGPSPSAVFGTCSSTIAPVLLGWPRLPSCPTRALHRHWDRPGRRRASATAATRSSVVRAGAVIPRTVDRAGDPAVDDKGREARQRRGGAPNHDRRLSFVLAAS